MENLLLPMGEINFHFLYQNTVEGNFMFFSKYLRAVDDW